MVKHEQFLGCPHIAWAELLNKMSEIVRNTPPTQNVGGLEIRIKFEINDSWLHLVKMEIILQWAIIIDQFMVI